MGAFMKDLPPRLDLEGLRPTARRPVIIAAILIILGSICIVVSVMFWQFLVNQKNFAKSFGSSPLLNAQLTRMPNGLDISAFAQKAESSLQVLADSISILFSDSISCNSRQSMPDGVVPIVSNEEVVRAFQDSRAPYLFKTIPISDGKQHALVGSTVQYHYASPWFQSLGTHSKSAATNVTNSRWVRATAALLTDWLHSFPEDPLQRREKDSMMGKLHIPQWVLPPNMIAHLYCALRVPVDPLAHELMANQITDKKCALIQQLWESTQPLSASSFSSLTREAQDSLYGEYILDSDTVPYLLLGTPAAPLPRDYDCTRRPWFLSAIQDSGVLWSPSYDDIGTDIPVVTLSGPITRLSGGRVQVIGVLAVDFFTRRLTEYPKPGSAYLLNFVLVLMASFLLLAIIVGTSRRRFDLMLWAVSTLVLLYAVKITLWATNAGDRYLGSWSEYPDFFLSMVTSVSFFMAAIIVFKKFRHEVGDPAPSADASQKGKLVGLFEDLRMVPDSYATSILSAVLVAVSLICLDQILGPLLHMGEFGFLTWMDALISGATAILFGFYFSVWCRRYFRGWFVALSFCSFALYGISQLAHPLFFMYSKYWYALAFAKAIPLFAVVVAIYLWARHRNFDRVRRAGTRAIILSRIGVPYSFVTIAGTLDDADSFLFVDRSTLRLLDWLSVPKLAMETYESNERIQGWVRSELGDDLYVPEDNAIRITDIFVDKHWWRLKTTLHGRRSQVSISKRLNDHLTNRTTLVKMIRDTKVILRGKMGIHTQ